MYLVLRTSSCSSSGAMNAEPHFASLEQFRLSDVKNTRRPLGQGSYGYVEEYIYRELKCAGKKLMPLLREGTRKEDERALLRRAADECLTLSQLKHPNIVQFLGVHFGEGDPAPILLMEYVPYTLSSFLDKYGVNIPPEISYGVLVDVARALCYLHGCPRPIVHRDLSANNVLLTRDYRAKISDLGTAKILDISVTKKAELCQKMTSCPGTPAYMPPEARVEEAIYDEKLDCYSYGVLLLHILSGEWPVRKESVRDNKQQVVVLNDIDCRRKYLDKVDDSHPLKGLIYECLKHKSERPSAKKILCKVQEVQKRFCTQESDRMTLLVQHKKDAERKLAMEREVTHLKNEKERMEHVHSEEEKVAALEMEQIKSDNSMFKSLVEIRNSEQAALEKRMQSKDELLRKKEEEITALKQKMDQEVDAMKKRYEDELCAYKKQKDEEMEAKEKEIGEYRESLERKEKMIEEAIVKSEERQRKAHEALHRRQSGGGAVMQYLRSGTQIHPLHHRAKPLHWREGPCLPIGMTAPQCVLINSSLYVGGGQTVPGDKDHRGLIFEYDIRDNATQKWKCPFSPCPTVYFGLGEHMGKLVVVGGEIVLADKMITGEVFMVDEGYTKWNGDEIPALKTPRIRACVVSFNGNMAACGGLVRGERETRECSSAVEVYKSGGREWCTVSPLPVPRAALRVTIIHETAYFMGGFCPDLTSPGKPNCVSIDLKDLFQADNENPPISWNTHVRDAPFQSCTPASLCGSLIALGGVKNQLTVAGGIQTDSVYAYSPTVDDWHLIGQLPIELSSATATTLPNGELLVFGGRTGDRDERNNDVYIGSLE